MLLHYTREIAQQENGTQHDQAADQDVPMDEDDLYLYSSKPKAQKEVNQQIYYITLLDSRCSTICDS